MFLKSLAQSFVHILMPRMCCACDSALFSHETVLCTDCLFHLPLTDFHLDKENESAKQLWGKLDAEFVTSMLYLAKSSRVERLLHRLKFKGYPEIGEFLGNQYATKLIEINQKATFDYIIPIPLHPIKLRKRGYNQAECFARGLSDGMMIPMLNKLLIRAVLSDSQISKDRVERYDNVQNVFALADDHSIIKGKNLLLVDDVLTTGATLCSAGNILLQAGAQVSVVTLARA